MRFWFLFAVIIFNQQALAQGVDFDKEFPLSEEDLYAPLIGENGELPSDYNALNTTNAEIVEPQAPENSQIDAEFERFYQENAQAIQEVAEPIYAEPTEGLGFVPQQSAESAEELSTEGNIQPPKNAKSIAVKDLPKASSEQLAQQQNEAQNAQTAESLKALENSVEKMELTIESIINKGLAAENSEKASVKPLNDMPVLTNLTEADVASVGLLNADSGFNNNVFDTVSRESAENFIQKVTTSNLQSTSLNKLVLNLLLTQANAPEGDNQSNSSWLAFRIQNLFNLGEFRHAELLLSKAGLTPQNLNQHEGLPAIWVQSKLVQGDLQSACPFVRENILNAGNVFWRKALLTCQLLTGDEKGFELSLNMLDQKTRREDALLYSLFDAVQGNADMPILKVDQELSALHTAVLLSSPDLVTPNIVPLLPDVALNKLAKNVALNMSLRIQAAESLVERFNFFDDIALLGLLYDKADFDPKVVESPGVERFAEAEVDGSIARALLWQGAKVSGLPSTRALTMKALWDRAYRDKMFRLAARLKPELRGIQADTNLAWLAPQVIEHSLLNGDFEHAQTWWGALKSNRSLSNQLAQKRAEIAIYMSFVEKEVSTPNFNQWLKTKSMSDEQDRQFIEMLLSLLEASEITFPDHVWQEMAQHITSYANQSQDMGALWLRLLGNHLEKQNMVPALNLIYQPFVEYKMDQVSVQTLSNVMTSLNFLGLSDTALNLTFEALIDTSKL